MYGKTFPIITGSRHKYSDPYSLDNLSSSLELAYVNLKVHDKFGFTIGKQFVNFGGYEYFVNSIKVREFSEFNNLLTCYQAGISGNWQINLTTNFASRS